jgi:hypothetical protein
MSLQGEIPRAANARDGDLYDFRAFLDHDYEPKINGVPTPFLSGETINYRMEINNFLQSAGDVIREDLPAWPQAIQRICQGMSFSNTVLIIVLIDFSGTIDDT